MDHLRDGAVVTAQLQVLASGLGYQWGVESGPGWGGGQASNALVSLLRNGTVTAASGSTNWFWPTTTTIGDGYWFLVTRTSGGSNDFKVDAGAYAGTWFNLNATHVISMTGAGSVSGTITFATDSGGANIAGRAKVTDFNAW